VSVGPGAYQMGGGGEQPFDRTGADVIGAMRHHLGPPRPYARLTEEERTEAEAAAREEAKVCRFCIAIHPLPNGPGCPRLLTFELDGDGRVVKGTYRTRWAGGPALGAGAVTTRLSPSAATALRRL